MKSKSLFLTLLLFLLLFPSSILANKDNVHVVPLPANIETTGGFFRFNEETQWIVEQPEQAEMLEDLLERFRIAAGFRYEVSVKNQPSENAVVLKTDTTLGKEDYSLDVNESRVRLTASGPNGFFYGMQTLQQLLPAAIFSSRKNEGVRWRIPGVQIKDSPRFDYRGFMLDVSRYFMPKKDLLNIIDYLALHKINHLHLHLVDDQGWRIEIKQYPELTDVGAWHSDRVSPFPMRQNPVNGEPTPSGGYYSHEDIREIVAYARERHIEIIPEIEMPAHTVSSLAAYPELACPVADRPIDVVPGMGVNRSQAIYCAGNDSVFTFLENVLDEVRELFPSEYIHIGGDEAQKDNWKQCPRCQARMKQENLEDEEALQSYFIHRISDYLKKHDKKLMGWDELTNGRIPDGATIFGWRGLGYAAFDAAEDGHPFILTPARVLYLIRYQGPQWFEPFTYFGNNTLRDVYAYEPTKEMDPDHSELLKGIQACLWSEFVTSPEDAEYLIFPRLAAFAETAWTQSDQRDWDDFLPRVDHMKNIYRKLDVNLSQFSDLNLFHDVKPSEGDLQVTLRSIRPDLDIRYTLNGSEPKPDDRLYEQPFQLSDARKVRAATFRDGERKGEILTLNAKHSLALGCQVKSSLSSPGLLTNGLIGSEKITDGEYVDLYNTGGRFVLDMGQPKEIQEVTLSFMNNYGRNAHLPSGIVLSASEDGETFQAVKKISLSENERFKGAVRHEFVDFEDIPGKVRYLNIELEKPGPAPADHVMAGQQARIAFDEIIVR